ncbi:hypothetical protein PMIN02_012276 [Paraphaeosphaeria minitans]|uniref:Uncharacterized protein n=1 Tax=Paraphaeosphaeria minitans TaxID=565426 RepID=A0A9P6GK08_9PLEO|nr:hypothetical protein PMIN01_04292 [Paraphaeosphaeria minitans]
MHLSAGAFSLTIETLHRGLSNDAEQSSPTLVIMTPTAAQDVWPVTIIPSIQRQTSSLSVHLKIELLCGFTTHLPPQGIPQHTQSYQDSVPMSFVGHSSAPVVKSGDSGSIVLHTPSGDWLGLLFGSTGTGAALFAPIDVILRDIEIVTGCKVLEPTSTPN